MTTHAPRFSPRHPLWAALAGGLLGCAPDAQSPAAASSDTSLPPVRMSDRSVPISGGGLAVDGTTIVALDAEQDRVWWGIAGEPTSWRSVDLEVGTWPFRAAIRGSEAAITLRGADRIALLDLQTGELRQAGTCHEPRGVDDFDGDWFVACATGGLYRHDGDLAVVATHFVTDDIRDVVADPPYLWLSTFRTAQIHLFRPDERTVPDAVTALPPYDMAANTAWRMVPHPLGGVMMLHENVLQDPPPEGIPETVAGCPSRVASSVTQAWRVGEEVQRSESAGLSGVLVGLDLAGDDTGGLWVSSLGHADPGRASLWPGLARFDENPADTLCEPRIAQAAEGEAISAIAVDPSGRRVALRYPFELTVDGIPQTLPARPVRADVGPEALAFHQVPEPADTACASCHPEGHDNAAEWTFADAPFRTMPLVGGLSDRELYTWDGDLPTFEDVLDEHGAAYVGVPDLAPKRLRTWIDGLEPVRRIALDPEAVGRGEDTFFGQECQRCHSDDEGTTDRTVKGSLVPSLVGVSYRAPYTHDGCRATLEAFLRHGCIDYIGHPTVEKALVDDLVAYLETL